ncbi:MAG: alpha-xylosidase [Anaerolineae bacterium]|nr:alpha-xylosidase [Anaerolineae bacterium]
MKQANNFMIDMLDLDLPEASADILWKACRPTEIESASNGDVFLTIPFQAHKRGLAVEANLEVPRREYKLRIRAYDNDSLRLSISFIGELPGNVSPMLELDDSLGMLPLTAQKIDSGWQVIDAHNKIRARVNICEPAIKHWSDLQPAPDETLDLELFPDGKTKVPFMAYDQFYPLNHDSMAMAFVERDGVPDRAVFSFYAEPNERFVGTGERFDRLDLSGRTFILENTDGLGVNSRRAYKNIPFYVSSRPYGLFVHSSAHMRLSLADISTRAAQGLVEEPALDLFVIGGESVERIVYSYRRLTGFPRDVPIWSYGTWMSRMTYFSEDEVRSVARNLRDGDFPCDVLHIDTGWFAKDWVCEWEFSQERFPDPESFIHEMLEDGYRISLWQMPYLGEGNKLFETAVSQGLVAPNPSRNGVASSDFSAQVVGGRIDFSNPLAVAWYQEMLARLLNMGVANIKTDFGESVHFDAEYQMPAAMLHNLYALLYQKAAYEITEQVTGEGIIWARASWAGSQRYPVHWGGDCAASWDGLAGSLRGGLHLGLSGFAFWSHDVPGFHGVPNFMNSWPADDLYVRWTQFGVFTSHFRYHGTSPREPYEYPAVADVVRQWWKLRYALLPYLVEQGTKVISTGLPMLQALVFHHEDDPTCWHIDDQYYFGDAFLVAPIINSDGVRDVYLPAGEWIDFWTGEKLMGGRWLKQVTVPLERMPLYAKYSAEIPVYPHAVQCTDEIDWTKIEKIIFDDRYVGLSASTLGNIIDFS